MRQTQPTLRRHLDEIAEAELTAQAQMMTSRLGASLQTIPQCSSACPKPVLNFQNHPWTNGKVERMNRTIKDATVSRYHYDSHEQIRTHLHDFIAAYNFARRLKTLKGLTPYEFLCKSFLAEPARFRLDPIH